ncbi:MAG: tRNA epoxyqueuosine(34) reductase QueG [Anaerolineae bacterium]|nr:tRNA epoxyqueuosine(34) reductase QueG [Anaerolineae bacterium]
MHTLHLQSLAAETGIDLAGVALAGPSRAWEAYRDWVAQGYAAEMAYLTRPDAMARRADPRRILPEARSVLVVAASYARVSLPSLPPLHGRISRYVWGAGQEEDYHRWLLRRLKLLVQRIVEVEGPFPYRCYVDTGPVLERAWAQPAGLGWVGNNTCLIHPRLGSYLFLGVALLGLELEPAPAPQLPTCGTCTRCMDACPTGAIVAPGVIDARRCLSYLTVEHRGPIPEALRPLLGDCVFGCDVCQEVCPWNRKAIGADAIEAPLATLDLPEVLRMDEVTFRARFRHTPIWRAGPEGLARNAAVVLGNLGDPAALPHLQRAAHAHSSPLVRTHAAWALTLF